MPSTASSSSASSSSLSRPLPLPLPLLCLVLKITWFHPQRHSSSISLHPVPPLPRPRPRVPASITCDLLPIPSRILFLTACPHLSSSQSPQAILIYAINAIHARCESSWQCPPSLPSLHSGQNSSRSPPFQNKPSSPDRGR